MQNYQSDPYAFLDGNGSHLRQGGNVFSRFASGFAQAIGLSTSRIGSDNGGYDELAAEWEKARQQGETMFILPEYQRFKHVFRKIDPRVIDNLCDENLE